MPAEHFVWIVQVAEDSLMGSKIYWVYIPGDPHWEAVNSVSMFLPCVLSKKDSWGLQIVKYLRIISS